MKKTHPFFFILSLLFWSACVSSARAESEQDIFRVETDLVGLYNPLGISLSASAYYRDNYSLGDSELWNALYWQAGGQMAVNPAYQRGGFHLEWVPIIVLQLRAQYDRYYFTGSNGSLLAFDNTDGPFGDSEIEARQGQEQSGYGNRYMLSMTLRAKACSFIIQNVTNLAKYEFPGDGPYYLEREYELLMATNDYLFSNQLFIMHKSTSGKGDTRYVGPYYDYVQVRQTRLERERLGLTYYQEYRKALAFLQQPRWYLQSGIYLTERNRQDEFYFVLGVGGNYDF